MMAYFSSSIPAEDPLKLDECRMAGKYMLELLKKDLKPRDIITRKSLHNAMVMVMLWVDQQMLSFTLLP